MKKLATAPSGSGCQSNKLGGRQRGPGRAGAPTGDGALDLALDRGRRDGGVVVVVGGSRALSLGGGHCADVPQQVRGSDVDDATQVVPTDKVDKIEAFSPGS